MPHNRELPITDIQTFEQYAEEGSRMDALKALDLLIKAYISQCGISAGMRTLIYAAGEVWRYSRLPLHPDNPLSMKHIKSKPFVMSMSILCKDYIPEKYDKYVITGSFDAQMLKDLCVKEINAFGKETMQALCWGIANLDVLL